MSPNVLITGASGYLGGTFLQYLKEYPIDVQRTTYALVRSDEQARQVQKFYDATPITLDLSDEAAITETLREKEISIVFWLIDAFKADAQLRFIKALEVIGKELKVQTHFLHTSGAKCFSSFAGHPTDRPLSDLNDDILRIQQTSKPTLSPVQTVQYTSPAT